MALGNKGKKDNESQNSDQINAEKEALLKQLEILNVSENTIQIALLATFLSFLNIDRTRITLLDQINDTEYAKGLPNFSEIPRLSNILFIYVTFTFLQISYNALQDGINANAINIEGLYESYLASLLVFVATLIRYFNLSTRAEDIESDF